MDSEVEARKRAAAERALEYVRDGMVVGLGSGSTSELFVRALGERVRGGLRIRGVATSDRVAELARAQAVPLATLEEHSRLDLIVDGADEIDPATFALIKGHGGALVREKLVAAAADHDVIVADDSKLVRILGERQAVPVAVVRFGWNRTAERLERLGCSATLRRAPDGSTPFVTDDGNYVLDCRFGPIAEPDRLAAEIKSIIGVVEHGLFIGLADRIVVAGPDGVTVFERSQNPGARSQEGAPSPGS